jgi:uncharacterized sodium:solute symporter family permease YidK
MNYQSVKKVWGAPLVLALITLFGLLAALLGTGVCYGLSWIAMVIPIFIICLKIWWQKTPSPKHK